jgi:hypothetical protein
MSRHMDMLGAESNAARRGQALAKPLMRDNIVGMRAIYEAS